MENEIRTPAHSPDYRAGLERAMSMIWTEKQRHSVISPEYFALAKLWDAMYREANPKDVH
ncbi:MAG: hypothetical protein HY079_07190 [Elusimicrobia bacterium]|nr:hypothetical protein [Elusimicrobiota bacterium]